MVTTVEIIVSQFIGNFILITEMKRLNIGVWCMHSNAWQYNVNGCVLRRIVL